METANWRLIVFPYYRKRLDKILKYIRNSRYTDELYYFREWREAIGYDSDAKKHNVYFINDF